MRNKEVVVHRYVVFLGIIRKYASASKGMLVSGVVLGMEGSLGTLALCSWSKDNDKIPSNKDS